MTIASFFVAIAVLVFATYRKGCVLDSVSEIAYIIPSWAFTAWIAVVGILLAPELFDKLPNDWKWVGFLVIAGLFAVAASPYYKTDSKVLHYGGGVLSMICASAVTAILEPVLLVMWALLAIPNKSWFFCAELLAYVLLTITILV